MTQQYAIIFADWLPYDHSHNHSHHALTGEFMYIGAIDECTEQLKRMSAAHPKWRLSIVPLNLG